MCLFSTTLAKSTDKKRDQSKKGSSANLQRSKKGTSTTKNNPKKNGSKTGNTEPKPNAGPTLASIITPEVLHQLELVSSDPNLSSLWNIKFYSQYGT